MDTKDKAAEALRLAKRLDALVIFDEVGSNNPLAHKAANMLRECAALLQAQPAEAANCESRAMFVARLENMQRQGDTWLTIGAVLALLNDCDMLAARAFDAESDVTATVDDSAPQPAEAGRVPPGWKLVPVEPTPEMVEATQVGPVNYPMLCWRAMLAAAPQPPKEQPAASISIHAKCSERLRRQGVPYPRTCQQCGLGPCREGLGPREQP